MIYSLRGTKYRRVRVIVTVIMLIVVATEDSADTLIGAAPQEQARFRAAPQYSCCFARDFLDCFNEGVDTANFFGNDRMDTSGLRQSTKLV